MKKRSITAFLTDSSLSQILGLTGVVTAAICFHSAAKMPANAQNATSLVMLTVPISFLISAVCQWRQLTNFYGTGAISIERGATELRLALIGS